MPTPASTRALRRRLLATLLAGGLVLAACGGGDDDDNGGGGGTEEGTDGTTGGGADGTTDGTDGGDSTPTTVETGDPVRGGNLVYAVESDTASPWLPASMICAAACHSTIGRTIFEPLVVVADDGNYYPYLLESIEPNEDFTVWTLVVRQGIKFHDGTDLDADAVATQIEAGRNSALLQAAVAPIQEVASDGNMTVTITMDSPWPAFPTYLNGQIGYIPSPTWTAAVAAGTASATEPVGTGPFKLDSYESGENGNLRASRFEDYWRGDGPSSVTGEGLPYLDSIEVRFIPDGQARSSALLAGDIDLIQTSNGVEITDLREEDGVVVDLLDSPFETETGYVLLNNSPTLPDGSANPVADHRVREALAHATNNEVLSETRTAGLFPVANGPFPPGTPGYLDDTGYPEFDVDAATALVDEYEAENGPLVIAYKTTTDPFNLTSAELLKSMWEEAGIEVTLDQIPQGDFINEALAGNFEAFGWRNHSGIDPDQQFVWWSSTTTTGIALNFGRILDANVDPLLDDIRTSTDPAERETAAQDLNRAFAENVNNLWNYWVQWGLVHDDDVFNVRGTSIPGAPDGVRGINMGSNLAGAIFPGEIFIDPDA